MFEIEHGMIGKAHIRHDEIIRRPNKMIIRRFRELLTDIDTLRFVKHGMGQGEYVACGSVTSAAYVVEGHTGAVGDCELARVHPEGALEVGVGTLESVINVIKDMPITKTNQDEKYSESST